MGEPPAQGAVEGERRRVVHPPDVEGAGRLPPEAQGGLRGALAGLDPGPGAERHVWLAAFIPPRGDARGDLLLPALPRGIHALPELTMSVRKTT